MRGFEQIAAQLLTDSLLTRREFPVFDKTGIALSAFAGFLLLMGSVGLLVALHAWLLTQILPHEAALLTSAAAFLAAGLVMVASGIAAKRRKARKPLHAAGHSLMSLLEEATEGLEGPIAENPRLSVMLASLAGYVAGDRLHH